METKIETENTSHPFTLNHPVVRYSGNPILNSHAINRIWTTPGRQVITAHNAGITLFRNKYIMLFRSHLRNGISVVGKATSDTGISDWEIDPEPFLKPCKSEDNTTDKQTAGNLREAGGVEDPRITRIDETYYITYSAYHGLEPDSVRVSLASTNDFKTVIRHGPVMDVDMRNVVLFPEKINGRYYALFRPNDHTAQAIGGNFTRILIGSTSHLTASDWEISSQPIMAQAGGPSSFSAKIGPGAPPLKTRHGWLSIFHGVRNTMDGNPYVLGVALHSLTNPEQVLVSNIPILFPTRADCRTTEDDYIHVPNVVFTCGALRQPDGTIYLYYGGNDTVMNLAFTHEDILAALCRQYPQNPLTGEPLYAL